MSCCQLWDRMGCSGRSASQSWFCSTNSKTEQYRPKSNHYLRLRIAKPLKLLRNTCLLLSTLCGSGHYPNRLDDRFLQCESRSDARTHPVIRSLFPFEAPTFGRHNFGKQLTRLQQFYSAIMIAEFRKRHTRHQFRFQRLSIIRSDLGFQVGPPGFTVFLVERRNNVIAFHKLLNLGQYE